MPKYPIIYLMHFEHRNKNITTFKKLGLADKYVIHIN
jgi:hypothetical protein